MRPQSRARQSPSSSEPADRRDEQLPSRPATPPRVGRNFGQQLQTFHVEVTAGKERDACQVSFRPAEIADELGIYGIVTDHEHDWMLAVAALIVSTAAALPMITATCL
jgi:hypothetical protein